jgi:hypothetical protein
VFLSYVGCFFFFADRLIFGADRSGKKGKREREKKVIEIKKAPSY